MFKCNDKSWFSLAQFSKVAKESYTVVKRKLQNLQCKIEQTMELKERGGWGRQSENVFQ